MDNADDMLKNRVCLNTVDSLTDASLVSCVDVGDITSAVCETRDQVCAQSKVTLRTAAPATIRPAASTKETQGTTFGTDDGVFSCITQTL
jgi:hypothetical protein